MQNAAVVHEHSQGPAAGTSTRQWKRNFALFAAVGLAYFLLAKLGLALPSSSGFMAVFWPAMGFGVGVLIGLGPNARWPVLAAITVANFFANLSSGDPPQIALATCLSGATECLLPAVLVERWFGTEFALARLRHVLGLLAAAAAGNAAGAACWIVASRLFWGPPGPIPISFLHWFMSDMVGFITLGPFVISLFVVARKPRSRRELIEGVAALFALAIMIAIIIPLPRWLWDTAQPISWLFPMLLWLTARCRVFFATAAASLVSVTVVSTTVFGIGHFGDAQLPIDDRILQAQSTILFVALSTFILAALFAERKESEARLAHANLMLEHERDHKLMNVQALTASIAHELNQPLTAISVNAFTALQWLKGTPPRHDEVRDALIEVTQSVKRTTEVFDGLRTLFGKGNEGQEPVDVNEIIVSVLRSLGAEMKSHRVDVQQELTAGLPLVSGHRGQLQEVIFNLVHNAIEAMESAADRPRILLLRTEPRGDQAIVVSVQDTGPGIDPGKIDGIFTAFFTTKPHGTGLGLAICRMIVENHSGKLTATSDGKSGTLFQFVLPIRQTESGHRSP